jgi:hypothetical protein
MPVEKRTTEDMLQKLRKVIASYDDLPEKEVYEALCEEAEGWDMRLNELLDEMED